MPAHSREWSWVGLIALGMISALDWALALRGVQPQRRTRVKNVLIVLAVCFAAVRWILLER
jgi:hypothetical protein